MIDLVCPATHQPLHRVPVSDVDVTRYRARPGSQAKLEGEVLVRSDEAALYPVVDGIPHAMVPEAWWREDEGEWPDIGSGRYAGPYVTMVEFDEIMERRRRDLHGTFEYGHIQRLVGAPEHVRESFPDPIEQWLPATNGTHALYLALGHLAPVGDARVGQIGGYGFHALLMAAAGAKEAVVVSPVTSELRYGRDLARMFGLDDRCRFVRAIAEELPFPDGSLDAAFMPFTAHHTICDEAFAEAARVKAPGGRFASLDVWRASRLYDVGIKLFGKAQGGEHCQPMNPARLVPARTVFDDAEISLHGTLFRYPMSVLTRLGRSLPLRSAFRLGRWEDALSARMPALQRLGSLVLIRA